jgi:5-methylcytosine-specific restriction endonuclease McrA
MRALLDDLPLGQRVDSIWALQINMLTGWDFPYYKRVTNQRNPADTHCLATSHDGETFVVWSWVKAINGYRADKNLYAAMRTAVQPQLTAFLKLQLSLGTVCAHCGAAEDLTVDHKSPTFKTLSAKFKSRYADLESNITNKGDGTGWFLAEPTRLKKWQRYHRKNATYQILCRACNASKGVNHGPRPKQA